SVAQRPDLRDAARPLETELVREPPPYAGGQSGAASAGRDREQQIPAADFGNAVEITERGHVLDIDEDTLRPRSPGEVRPLLFGQANDPKHVETGEVIAIGQAASEGIRGFGFE